MFPFNIILVNPREEELRSYYTKVNNSSFPLYSYDFNKSKCEVHFILKETPIELQHAVLKLFAERYPGVPVLLLETIVSVENMSKPKLILKEWKNGEVTVKEKTTKSTKAEEFTFINELPEDIFNQFTTQAIEPAVAQDTPEPAPVPPQITPTGTGTTTNPTTHINTNWTFHTNTNPHP